MVDKGKSQSSMDDLEVSLSMDNPKENWYWFTLMAIESMTIYEIVWLRMWFWWKLIKLVIVMGHFIAFSIAIFDRRVVFRIQSRAFFLVATSWRLTTEIYWWLNQDAETLVFFPRWGLNLVRFNGQSWSGRCGFFTFTWFHRQEWFLQEAKGDFTASILR